MKNYEKYSEMVEAWRAFVFPARPSESEMEIFDELMSHRAGQKLLILGATPEFRDLAMEHKMDVTCADVNPDMLEGMKFIMKEENPNEKLVECNWLETPFEDNSFDLVYAEQSINIIATDKFEEFFKESQRVLKSGGEMVLKTIRPNEDDDDATIKIYKDNNYPIHFLYDNLFHVKKRYDESGQGGHAKVGEAFVELLKEGKISQSDHDEFFAFWGSIVKADLKLNVMEKDEIEDLMGRYFKIKDMVFGKDRIYHRLHPIYILEK